MGKSIEVKKPQTAEVPKSVNVSDIKPKSKKYLVEKGIKYKGEYYWIGQTIELSDQEYKEFENKSILKIKE